MAQITSLERIYNLLENSQWWPRDRLLEMQHLDLTLLIRHAMTTSPFYRTRLDCIIRPNGTIDWDRWTDIPIMTRAQLSFEGGALQSTKPIQSHGPIGKVKTSGSTGDPVEFCVTRFMNDLSVASLWRGQKWAKMDWSDTIIHMGADSAKWKTGDSMGPWGPSWLQGGSKGNRIFTTYTTSPKERADLMQKFQSKFAVFTSGVAITFMDYLQANESAMTLKAVQFIGGSANDYIRKDFRRLLKTDVVELYSSKEGGRWLILVRLVLDGIKTLNLSWWK